MYGKDPIKITCVICDCSFELSAETFFAKDELVCPNCGIDSRGKFAPFAEAMKAFFAAKKNLHRIFEFDLGL
ncbi:MAG: hypothetical protein SWH61_05325 [Thermodesulfobacteriota bacterium]|nr:hypothetical protein [Thermodesulfobacteriota bacterium]